MTWRDFNNGRSIGARGSEDGLVLADEEHPFGARITLEENCPSAPATITCGISGWMVHTRFFSSSTEAIDEFKRMKRSLSKILDSLPERDDPDGEQKCDDVSRFIDQFVKEYPSA
jgi:hypothetical protein